MSTAPVLSIKVTYPNQVLEPSYFDLQFLGTSIFGSGAYDAWCVDADVSIQVYGPSGGVYSTTLKAGLYSSYELGAIPGAFPTIESPQYLDEANWLMNQHFTVGAGAYTINEVQAALWTLLGDANQIATLLPGTDSSRVNTLVQLALQHDGFAPDITDDNPNNDKIGLLLNPWVDSNGNNVRDPGETAQQPLIVMVKSAALGDRVWHDVNGDGIQNAAADGTYTEQGIAGAVVHLVRDRDGDGAFTSPGEVLATTTTDANGNYVFKSLTPGLDYQVQFFLPAGFDAASPRQQGSSIAADSDGAVSNVVVLAAGEWNKTIDAGYYKHVSVGDFVWHDQDADGIQDSGETGVGGVRLTLTGTTGNGQVVVRSTITAADGSYLFDALPPGTYHVTVDATNFGPGGALSGYQASPIGQGTDPALDSNASPTGTTPLALMSGEQDRNLDFGYFKATAAIGDRVWEDRNANGQQDAGENGIAGATVRLYTCVDGAPGALVATTTTDASGNYAFTGLMPGAYIVAFETPTGYTLSTANVGADASDSDAGAGGLTGCYTLASGETNNTVDAGFWRPAAIGDRVWLDANANGQQDAGEAGVAGVTVELYACANGLPSGSALASTTTDANGNYGFTGLKPGDYVVKFITPAGYSLSPVNVGADATDSDAGLGGFTACYNLESGETDNSVDAGLVRQAPGIAIVKDASQVIVSPNTPVTFTYSVSNTGGVPLSNIVVTDDNATPEFAEDDFNPTAVLGANGKNIGDLDGDGLLDTNEIWKYSASVIPAVQMTITPTAGGPTYDAGMLSYETLANGDIRVYYRQDNNFNDNTYGTGSDIGWTSQGKIHKFSDLTGSDKAGFEVRASDGTVLFKFYQDYITASTTNIDGYTAYSGYQSLGFSGGDGSLVSGGTLNAQAATLLKDFDSTLELNLNQAGIANNGIAYTSMTVNSPVGDARWDVVNGYYFTISAAAFTGGKTFGGVTVFDQHNSPAKTGGSNSYVPTIVGGASVNTAVVTGTDGSTTVTASDDATVQVVTGKLGALGDRVWLDLDADGVQDAGEAGIAGVKLTLLGDFDQNGTIDYTATTTTGANGVYTFTGLPAGEYSVIVDTTTLPANLVQTYDLDGLDTPNEALRELAPGQTRTDFDFGYVPTAPGFALVKTANKTSAAFGEAITYTYEVSNTGTRALANVVLRDDNATPGDASDDFLPSYLSGDDGDGLLETGEVWKYTATVTPPIALSATVNGQTIAAGSLSWQTLANGDIRVTYLQNTGVNDNTYGTGAAADWSNGHKFGDLTGSDKAGFELKDANGVTVMKFYMDYITAASSQEQIAGRNEYTTYSGYRSLGVTGGDGSISIGSATNLYDFDSTLELNLNRAGYTGMIVNSPVGDPNWNVVNGYSFTVKASAFGSAGFGSASVFDQHNSPSKLGVNTIVPTATVSESTNTAIVTATLDGNTVVAIDDATVLIGASPAAATKFFVVDIGSDDAYKYSANGTAVGDFALQAGNTDPRDIASNADGSRLWVLDKDKNVNVYTADGTPVGLWKADGLGKEPEGITLDGGDLWMADRDRKIYWYDNAASNASGADSPEKIFTPSMSGSLKGIVTDGTYLWVVTEGGTDYVYRFEIVRNGSGAPTGLSASGVWKLATANTKPTGITLDPTGQSDSLWVVDESSDTVYEYGGGRNLTAGTGTVTASFKLAAGNTSPQGIADPLAASADTFALADASAVADRDAALTDPYADAIIGTLLDDVTACDGVGLVGTSTQSDLSLALLHA